MEQIREWLLGLTGAAVICAVATELCPRGPVRSVIKLLCALVMGAALLSPLISFDFSAWSLSLAEYREAAAALTERAEEVSAAESRQVIERRLRTYILDKAQSLGTPLTDARAEARWSTRGVWYPVSAELWGPWNAGLSAWLEAELGIPAQAQIWRDDGERGSEIAQEDSVGE